MKRDEMIELRTSLVRGVPPYQKDSMGNFVRDRSGTPGLDELKRMSDFSPLAPTVRLILDTQIKILDHMLERAR